MISISITTTHFSPPLVNLHHLLQTFDCDFPPNSVWYTHSGSPLLREDNVKLMVHHFTKTDTISRTVIVKVNFA